MGEPGVPPCCAHEELIELGGLYAALVARDEVRALELEGLA